MSSVVIAGDTSGTVTLQAPAEAGSTVLNLPDSSGNLLNITSSGVFNIPGTGSRITGDFSSFPIANRLAFQSSTTNGNTAIFAIPNGSATVCNFQFYNNSDTTNASYLFVGVDVNGNASLQSARTGTGTYLPMTFFTNNAERMRIATNGDLSFNSGYGSVAVAYGCRAWVNFNGTGNPNLTGTYSQTGTIVTVSITGHGYVTGQSAFLDFISGTAVDGVYEVTVTDANTFTVTQASRTTSGNVINRRNTIRASGNVSSVSDNAVGDYTVNFINAMPDADYAASGMCQGTSNGYVQEPTTQSKTTSSLRVVTISNANAVFDAANVYVAIFR